MFNKLSKWLNGLYDTWGKFVSEHKLTYIVALSIITVGGFIGHFFGWAFSLFVPGWFVFVGLVFAKKYGKKK